VSNSTEQIKEKLRPLYSELKGYLAQVPDYAEGAVDTIQEKCIWELYNKTVDLINEILEDDFRRFRIELEHEGEYIFLHHYRNMLGGLISRLHGEYFADEPNPLDGVPSTVIAQSQHQNQSIMLLEIQSIIYGKLPNYPDGSKEKDFLQKLKIRLALYQI
jgi:hypothetical protein